MSYDFLKIEKPIETGEIDNLIACGLKIPDSVEKKVGKILKEIELNGDKAVVKFCRQFDRFKAEDISDIRVTPKEMESALPNVRKEFPELIEALEVSYKNIEKYHTVQFKKEAGSWYIKPDRGKEVGQILRPLERVGIYI